MEMKEVWRGERKIWHIRHTYHKNREVIAKRNKIIMGEMRRDKRRKRGRGDKINQTFKRGEIRRQVESKKRKRRRMCNRNQKEEKDLKTKREE